MKLLKDHKSIRPSLEHLLANDRYFKKFFTADEIDAITHNHRKVSFESFARTIVGQQLSVKAAATIWGRVELLASPFTPENVLKLKDEKLRAAGLSYQKIKYLRGLSQAVLDETFDPDALKKLSDEKVIEAITALNGFGRWSAEMVLMFALARPDVFSGGDLGLREGIKRVMKLKERPTDNSLLNR